MHCIYIMGLKNERIPMQNFVLLLCIIVVIKFYVLYFIENKKRNVVVCLSRYFYVKNI